MLALDIIEQSRKKNFIIFSDSRSSLEAISKCNATHPYLNEVLNKLTYLHQKHYNIILCWIPSHVCITGNEKADTLTKKALQLHITPCTLPYTDPKHHICSYTKQLWENSWTTLTSNKLFNIQPHLGFWPPYRTLSR